MKTAKAMRNTGLKYFSALTAKQKDNTVRNIVIMKEGLFELPQGLAMGIIKALPLDQMFAKFEHVEKSIKGQKFFKMGKVYYPLNLKSILKD